MQRHSNHTQFLQTTISLPRIDNHHILGGHTRGSIIKAHQLTDWSKDNPIKKPEQASRVIKGQKPELQKSILKISPDEFLKNLPTTLNNSEHEVASLISIDGLGELEIATPFDENQNFYSLFVGEGLTPFKFNSEREAAKSSKRIMQKILNGSETIKINLDRLQKAIKEGKIALPAN